MQDSSVTSPALPTSNGKIAFFSGRTADFRQVCMLAFVYALSAIVFLIDVSIDFPLAAGVLYVPLVLTATRSRQRHTVWKLAGLACVLTAVGLLLPHYSPVGPIALVNRLLSIGAILLTASLVSDQQKTKARLASAIARADAAEIAKTRLLRNASHDFRNSLNAVLGFTELLKDDCRSNQRDALAAIEQGGRRLLDSVENLIDLTALDEQGPCLGAIDMHTLLSEAITKAKITAEGRSVAIVWDPPFDALPPVQGDQWAVRRIMDNLFQNAVKFSPIGGRVRTRLRSNAGAIVVEIADEGCGMKRETIEQLSEPLLGIEHYARSDTDGLGIGLALANKLADLTGGRIEISSQPGRGTTASLALPFSP